MSSRRLDIDGLRALSVVLVVVYHVWLGRVSGGVDVFLLVSAYFLTESFVRRSETIDVADLLRFWARRFSRLMPAAAAVIVVVLVFTAVALPGSQWRAMWAQAWASLSYTQNWALTEASVDYYAREEVFPSALQHFWSLSVQGQVFVLWPLLILLAIFVSRRLRISPASVLRWMFGTVFVVSLAYSVYWTVVDQQAAYFSTWARLWEFALGSLAALTVPSWRVRPRWAETLGWLGLVGLVTCGLVLDVGAGFPGIAALWPTLAAVAVITAGQGEVPSRVSRLLGAGVLTWIGRRAYALYLTHWPVLVVFMVIFDRTSVGVIGGAVVIASSVLCAYWLQRLVEVPVARVVGSAKRGAAVIAASVLVVAVPLAAWQGVGLARSASGDPAANPGAAVLMPWISTTNDGAGPLAPASTSVADEWVFLGSTCDGPMVPESPILTDTCFRTEYIEGAPTFVAIGDSHAQQWLGAVLPTLNAQNWNVISILKARCSFAPDEDAEDDCREWREEALAFAEQTPADVVMLMGTKAVPDSSSERVPYGLDRAVQSIAATGSQLLLVRDNPRFTIDMYRCVEDHGKEACTRPASESIAAENPALTLAEAPEVFMLDLTDYLCPKGVCEAVVGNVAVYLDDNHLTATYARSMAPAALAAFREMPGIPLG